MLNEAILEPYIWRKALERAQMCVMSWVSVGNLLRQIFLFPTIGHFMFVLYISLNIFSFESLCGMNDVCILESVLWSHLQKSEFSSSPLCSGHTFCWHWGFLFGCLESVQSLEWNKSITLGQGNIDYNESCWKMPTAQIIQLYMVNVRLLCFLLDDFETSTWNSNIIPAHELSHPMVSKATNYKCWCNCTGIYFRT